MAYVPKDWETGEVITEEALDHIEQGIANIGGGVALINVTSNNDYYYLGKSYNDIVAMVENGTIPIAVDTVANGSKTFYELASFAPSETVGGTFYPYSVTFHCGWAEDAPNMEFSANTATEELTTEEHSGGGPA
jgi:hypothetical protein